MADYELVKAYRNIYHDNKSFRDACHAAAPLTFEQRKMDESLTVFIEQEAMYQQLEQAFYPCRAPL